MCKVLRRDLLIKLNRLFKPSFSQPFLYKLCIQITLVLNRKWDTCHFCGYIQSILWQN